MGDSHRTRLRALTLLCGVTEFGIVLAVALIACTPVSVADSYWADLFRGVVLLGFALPFLFVPIAIAAMTDVVQRVGADETSSSPN